MLKIADFANFGPKYLGPQTFPRHAVCGSKLELKYFYAFYTLIHETRIFSRNAIMT